MDFDLPFNVEKQNQARRLKHMELELMEEQEKKRISNKEKQSLNYLDDENFAVDVQTKGKPNQANRSQTKPFEANRSQPKQIEANGSQSKSIEVNRSQSQPIEGN